MLYIPACDGDGAGGILAGCGQCGIGDGAAGGNGVGELQNGNVEVGG